MSVCEWVCAVLSGWVGCEMRLNDWLSSAVQLLVYCSLCCVDEESIKRQLAAGCRFIHSLLYALLCGVVSCAAAGECVCVSVYSQGESNRPTTLLYCSALCYLATLLRNTAGHSSDSTEYSVMAAATAARTSCCENIRPDLDLDLDLSLCFACSTTVRHSITLQPRYAGVTNKLTDLI